MKSKWIYIILALILISSCKKDETKIYVAENLIKPEIIEPIEGTSLTLVQADSNKVLTFIWSEANYGFPTVVSYIMIMDTIGANGKKPQLMGATTNDTSSMYYKDFNKKLLALKLKANLQRPVRIKVRAMVNDKLDTLFSQEIKMIVTPY
jgi:starch-binding outer membrane protein SusE/F